VAGIQILIATDAARAAGAGDKEQSIVCGTEKARWGGGRAGSPSGRLRREATKRLSTPRCIDGGPAHRCATRLTSCHPALDSAHVGFVDSTAVVLARTSFSLGSGGAIRST